MLEQDSTVDISSQERPRSGTLGHVLEARLTRLLGIIGQRRALRSSVAVTRLLTRDWRHESVLDGPRWNSDITDDHSPFEFSLALDGTAETLRILTEPQDPDRPSLQANWRRGTAIQEDLARFCGAKLGSFEKVSDLFEPTKTDTALFGIWHSAILSKAGKPEFKIYLNPGIHGAEDGNRLVTEAVARLGLSTAWASLAKQALRRPGIDRAVYFSVDLSQGSEARAKIYVAHPRASTEDLTRVLEGIPGFAPADMHQWLQLLVEAGGPFSQRPLITCFALRRQTFDLHSATLHVPVRCYAPDDFSIARRVCSLLSFPQRVRYMRALTGFAERPLENGPGLQTYVSLRASPGKQAVTVYLSPQVYSDLSFRYRDAQLGPLDHAHASFRARTISAAE